MATENDADRIIKHIRISDEDEIEVEPKTRTIVVDGVEQEEKVGPEFY